MNNKENINEEDYKIINCIKENKLLGEKDNIFNYLLNLAFNTMGMKIVFMSSTKNELIESLDSIADQFNLQFIDKKNSFIKIYEERNKDV